MLRFPALLFRNMRPTGAALRPRAPISLCNNNRSERTRVIGVRLEHVGHDSDSARKDLGAKMPSAHLITVHIIPSQI